MKVGNRSIEVILSIKSVVQETETRVPLLANLDRNENLVLEITALTSTKNNDTRSLMSKEYIWTHW